MAVRRAILWAALAALLHAPATSAPAPSTEPEKIVFAAWNVRNYRLAPTPQPEPSNPPKTETSADAVATILAGIAPDIVGLCEIGTREDLTDLQRRLAARGLALPHAEWVGGADADRHLALLSRLPITAAQHDTRATVAAGGPEERVQRGFLDCTVAVRPGFALRLLGAHFKSRRPVAGFNQAEFRRQESLLFRRRIETVLEENPDAPLLIFGDLNDAKNSPAVEGLLGRAGTPGAVALLALTDADGESWTYRWAEADEYSRVDYVMVSAALRPLVDRRASGIPRARGWTKASDHRPLVVTLRLPPTKP